MPRRLPFHFCDQRQLWDESRRGPDAGDHLYLLTVCHVEGEAGDLGDDGHVCGLFGPDVKGRSRTSYRIELSSGSLTERSECQKSLAEMEGNVVVFPHFLQLEQNCISLTIDT